MENYTANSGLYVIPMRLVPRGDGTFDKVPLPEGNPHENATRDHVRITAWWTTWPDAEVGYSTGKSGVVTADIDVKKGKDGYARLSERALDLPNTFSYATPSGGRHFIYASPLASRLSQKTDYLDMEGVDRQTGKSLAVLYADQAPAPEEIAEAPAWALETTGNASYAGVSPYTGDADTWMAQASIGPLASVVSPLSQKIMDTARSLPHVGNGDVQTLTMRLAMARVQNHPGASTAYQVVKDRYWSTSNESDRKKEAEWSRLMAGAIGIAEAAKAAGETTDYASWQTMSEPRPHAVTTAEAIAQDTEPAIAFIKLSDIRKKPKPQWWVDGLVRQSSLAIVAGAGGLGKTFWSLHVAACVATGTAWFDHAVRPGKVLYVASEGIEDFPVRIDALCDAHGIDAAEVEERMSFVETGVSLSNPKSTELLKTKLAADPYDLIVLDTFSQLSNVANENDAAMIAGVMREALAIRKVHPGSTILIVHHATKESGKMRGSSAFRDNVDTVIAMTGKSTDLVLSTYADDSGKQRSGAPVKLEGFYLAEHMDSVVMARQATVAPARTAPNADADVVWGAFDDMKVRTLAQVAKATGLDKRKVERITGPWREDGTLQRKTAADGTSGYARVTVG